MHSVVWTSLTHEWHDSFKSITTQDGKEGDHVELLRFKPSLVSWNINRCLVEICQYFRATSV